MTRTNQPILPLARHGFRQLKWFLILNTVIAAFCGFMLTTSFQNAAEWIWWGNQMDIAHWAGLGNVVSPPIYTLVVLCGILSVTMALAQQLTAYHPRNAQQMAALPYTRGKQLLTEISSGILCYTVPIALFALYALVCRLFFVERMALYYRSAPFAQLLAGIDTPWMIVAPLVKGWLLITSAYALTQLIGHLFGNAFITVGFLGGVALFAYVMSGLISSYCWNLGQLYTPVRGNEFYQWARDALLWLLTPSIPNALPFDNYNYDTYARMMPAMPWDALAPFALVHVPLISLCLAGCRASRRRLSIENLGNPFLFKASRWAAVGFLTLWPLTLPLLSISEYKSYNGTYGYNTLFPLYFIPAIVVFAVSWWFLARERRGSRRRGRAGAVAMLLCLSLSLGCVPAKAEGAHPVIVPQYDAQMLNIDVEKASRDADLLMDLAKTNLSEDAQTGWEEDYRYSEMNGAQAIERLKHSAQREKNLDYWELDALSSDYYNQFYEWETAHDETCADIAAVLGEHGYLRLSGAILSFLKAGDGMEWSGAYEDGMWLSLRRYKSVEYIENEQPVRRTYTNVMLYVSTPISLAGSAALQAAVEANTHMRRRFVYSNGQVDTLNYEIRDVEDGAERYYGSGSLILFLEQGSVQNALLELPYEYAVDERLQAPQLATLGAVMTQAMGIAPAQADGLVAELSAMLSAQRTGKGSSGSIAWSVEKKGRNGPLFRIMLSAQ